MEGIYLEYITVTHILYVSALDILVYKAWIPGLNMSSNLCHLFFMSGQGKGNLHYTLKWNLGSALMLIHVHVTV